MERLSILAALGDDPVAEMSRLGLFELNTIKWFFEIMVLGDKKGDMGERCETVPSWLPFLPPEPFAESAYKIKPMGRRRPRL